jgi:hypothetical protein
MTTDLLDVAKGLVSGERLIRVHGRRNNIAGSEEDVWPGGELGTPVVIKTFPTSASALSVVSDNSADTATGTGAQRLVIVGLDSDWREIAENIALNGTTSVSTTQTFLRVNDAYVERAGSGAKNAGIISVTHSGNLQAVIVAGAGSALMTHQSVPVTKRALVVRTWFDCSVEDVQMRLYQQPAGLGRRIVRDQKLGFAPLRDELPDIVEIGGRTDLWMAALVGTGTAYVAAGYDLLLTPPKTLISFQDAAATYTRSGDAWYHVATDALAKAGPNVRRFEDRGDGYGPQLLIEGARTNVLPDSEALGAASWTNDAQTLTSDDGVGAFGELAADRLACDGTPPDRTRWFSSTSTRFAVSCYAKRGSQGTQGQILPGTTGGEENKFTVPFDWGRFSAVHTSGVSITRQIILCCHWNAQAAAGTTGDNHLWWGAQVEDGVNFPSSYIKTSGATATRNADVLTFPSAPREMRFAKWSFDVWPAFASGDLLSGDAFVLFSFGSSKDVVQIHHNGTDVGVEIVADGQASFKARSLAITFSRHQRLRVTIDTVSKIVNVQGATTGSGDGTAGSAWAFPPVSTTAPLRIGGITGGAAEAFCRIGEPLAVT